METKVESSQETEVLLRTLSSDTQSAQHGDSAPVPEVIKITSSAEQAVAPDTDTQKPRAPRKIGRTIFMTILLVAIIAVGYFYLYPKVKVAFTGEVSQ